MDDSTNDEYAFSSQIARLATSESESALYQNIREMDPMTALYISVFLVNEPISSSICKDLLGRYLDPLDIARRSIQNNSFLMIFCLHILRLAPHKKLKTYIRSNGIFSDAYRVIRLAYDQLGVQRTVRIVNASQNNLVFNNTLIRLALIATREDNMQAVHSSLEDTMLIIQHKTTTKRVLENFIKDTSNAETIETAYVYKTVCKILNGLQFGDD